MCFLKRPLTSAQIGAIGDINGDGFPEVVVGSPSSISIYNHDGTPMKGASPLFSQIASGTR